jgi:predicted phosphodiesterase
MITVNGQNQDVVNAANIAANTTALAEIAQDVALKRNTADKIALADMAQDTIDAFNGDGTVPPSGSVTTKSLTDSIVALPQTQFAKITKNYVRNDEAFWTVGDYNNTYAYRMISDKVYLPADTALFAEIVTSLDGTALNINQTWFRLFDASNTYLGVINIYSTSGALNISSATYPTYSYCKVVLTNSSTTTLVLADFFGSTPFVQVAAGSVSSAMVHSHALDIDDEAITLDNIDTTSYKKLRVMSGKPDFKIVFISDLHGNVNVSTNALTRMPHMVAALNAEDALEKIDFVIINGDLATNTTGNDAIPALIANNLSSIRMPYYAVAGNHDLATEANWISNFGYGKNYILSCNGIDIVVIDQYSDDTVADPDTYGWDAADIDSDWADAAVAYLTASTNSTAIIVGHYITNLTNIMKIVNHAKVVCGFVGHVHDEVDTVLNGKTLYRDGHYSFHATHDTPWSYRVLKSVSGELSTYIVHPAASYPQIDYSGSSNPELAALGVVAAWDQAYEASEATVIKAGYDIKVMYP